MPIQSDADKKKEEDKKKKEEFLEGLDTYYSLKAQYEEEAKKQKNKIINNPNLSKREKQREFKKLKPKCVHCKRPVGTFFSTFYDEAEEGRKIKAICGDKAKPCELNIEINLGKPIRLDDYLAMDEADISELKLEIIKDKNELIFGYITTEQALEKFEKTKEKLAQYTSSYELALEKYMMVTHNQRKMEELKKLDEEIEQNIVHIRDGLKKSLDRQSVHDIVLFEMEEMIPKVVKKRELTYPYCDVECSESECHLIQKRITVEQLETNLSETDIGVLSMVA